jgi:hypothetical protein
MKRLIRLAAVAALAVAWAAVPPVALASEAQGETKASSCELGNGVHHVVSIVFDNTHFTRDNPNVPSDLEQMPHLLNFIKSNGTLLSNHHTPLISHTATDILTSLTGVYGDRMGQPVSNSYRYFNPDGSSSLGVSFAYWTAPLFDPISKMPTDTKYTMLTADGKNAPAPWVPFTRAGCNVGGVSTANIELENTNIDIPTVFGPNSAQAAEVTANPAKAFSDFVGIAVHCAKGNPTCSSANGGVADKLPDEPGGYSGYGGLFGHTYVAPAVGGIKAMDGTTITGFPGFDGMPANVTLGYVAAMQEHGVAVTYAYISDSHDKHPSGPSYGPGQAGYVAALKANDEAFAKFFTRLSSDGITAENTVFVVTSDEGDHFVGGAPTPAGCNGVTVACSYSKIGELNGNLAGLLATQQGITTPFKVHADDAPTFYITGNPAQDALVTRNFERATGKLTAVNPMTGQTDHLSRFLADQTQMKLMHMVSADPARTPTFTMFADSNYYLFAGAPNCNSPCVTQQPGFAWNHGDYQPDITTTWLGLVGPDVRRLGVTNKFWTDHADVRPTLLALTGLKDDYAHQGSPITRVMTEDREDLTRLAVDYKKINAPVGQLSMDSLAFATKATMSTNAAVYANADTKIAAWTARRDTLAAEMIALLDTTAPGGTDRHNDRNVHDLITQAEDLLVEVRAAAG